MRAMFSSLVPAKGFVIVLAWAVLTLTLAEPAVQAGPAGDVAISHAPSPQDELGASPLTANIYWDRFVEFLRRSINSRRRLIQITTIGVCIGLFIMFRSKKTH